MRLLGNLMDKPMFCCCASQSDDDNGEIPSVSVGFYFLPRTIFHQLIYFIPFRVPIAAFPVALLYPLNASISPLCSFGCPPPPPAVVPLLLLSLFPHASRVSPPPPC